MLDQDLLTKRAEHNKIYQICLYLCRSWVFNTLVSFSVIINAVLLAFDQYPLLEQKVLLDLETANFVLVCAFCLEICIKLTGYGLKIYFKDMYQTLDFVILLLILVDLIIAQTIGQQEDAHGSLTLAMRMLRILRMLRLATHWKRFQKLLDTIGNTLIDLSSFFRATLCVHVYVRPTWNRVVLL